MPVTKPATPFVMAHTCLNKVATPAKNGLISCKNLDGTCSNRVATPAKNALISCKNLDGTCSNRVAAPAKNSLIACKNLDDFLEVFNCSYLALRGTEGGKQSELECILRR